MVTDKVYRLGERGVCLYHLKSGFNPFHRVNVSEVRLNRILSISGVEELTYHLLSQTVVIIYDLNTITPKRLCLRLNKIFPNPQYMQKEFSLKKIRKSGPVRSRMDNYFGRIDRGLKEKINKCKDLALIVPVGATIQPVKMYFRRVIAPTWLEFIWTLIIL